MSLTKLPISWRCLHLGLGAQGARSQLPVGLELPSVALARGSRSANVACAVHERVWESDLQAKLQFHCISGRPKPQTTKLPSNKPCTRITTLRGHTNTHQTRFHTAAHMSHGVCACVCVCLYMYMFICLLVHLLETTTHVNTHITPSGRLN